MKLFFQSRFGKHLSKESWTMSTHLEWLHSKNEWEAFFSFDIATKILGCYSSHTSLADSQVSHWVNTQSDFKRMLMTWMKKKKEDTECSHEQNWETSEGLRIRKKKERTSHTKNSSGTSLSKHYNVSKLLSINVQFSFHKTMSHHGCKNRMKFLLCSIRRRRMFSMCEKVRRILEDHKEDIRTKLCFLFCLFRPLSLQGPVQSQLQADS